MTSAESAAAVEQVELEVKIREMKVEDIAEVYLLGQELFSTMDYTALYRTWDAHEVTANFNQDPRLSLVAEAANGKVVGFALGTTYEKETGGWRYGHLLWMGVSSRSQRSHVGSQLYREMERRMRGEGVRMIFIDAARSNAGAIKFFKRMGFGRPEAEVWMSKIIRRARKRRNERLIPLPRSAKHPRRTRRLAG
jgi:ribosomal protein S18 acetylase RimI-like enzyme